MENGFGSSSAGFLIFLLVILVIVLLVVVVNLNMKMERLQKRYNLFMKGSDGQSVEKAMSSRLRELGKLRSRQEKSREDLIDLQHQYNSMLCKYGIVKYDAFEDVGGKMSFALAMLDQTNTGFVLNAIHSRDNCYLYLKDVVKGTSYIMLSDEEVEALRRASRYGEAEMAAAATRRKKHEEERVRKEAVEEAKAERKAAVEASQKKRRAETPEEAELRMLEEIIANAESKSAGAAPSAQTSAAAPSAAQTYESQTPAAHAAQPGGNEAGQAADQMRPFSDVIRGTQTARQAPEMSPAEQLARQAQQVSAAAQRAEREAAAREAAERTEMEAQRAAARRIDDGMPELTE